MQDFADACGLSKGYISMLEHDRHPQNNKKVVPSLNTYAKLAKGMHVSLGELLSNLPEDAPVLLSNMAASTSLTDGDLELLSIFNEINDEGKDELLKYARLLASSGQYKKHSEPELVEA